MYPVGIWALVPSDRWGGWFSRVWKVKKVGSSGGLRMVYLLVAKRLTSQSAVSGCLSRLSSHDHRGVFIEQVVREGGYCVDCRIVCVIVHFDDQERMCA